MYDVIVVGAGPTGSLTAAILAKAGCHVLLADRETFPRDKPCGDAIPTSPAANTLGLLTQLGFQKYVKGYKFHIIRTMYLHTPNGKIITFPKDISSFPFGIGFTIPRLMFDNMLFQMAIQSGATFEQINVTTPLSDGKFIKGIAGQTPGSTPAEREAHLIIAADGATSVIRRKLDNNRLISPHHCAIAIRGYAQAKNLAKGTLNFHYRNEWLPGYGWVFSMGQQTANVGVYLRTDTYQKQDYNLRQLLDQYVISINDKIDETTLTNVKSWSLPLGSKPYQRVFNGAILAGDAGSLIEPLFGGGIFNGMISGKIAAETALKALDNKDFSAQGLAEYETRLNQTLGVILQRQTLTHQHLFSHAWILNTIGNLSTWFPSTTTTTLAKAMGFVV